MFQLSQIRLHRDPNDSNRDRRRRRGFTIVELLVVIAIIGVLVAILLPAVMMARAAVLNASCQANLRQIAIACQTHADTNRHFPHGKRNIGNPVSPSAPWSYEILPQIEQITIYSAGQTAFDEQARMPSTFMFGFESPPHIHLATVMPLYSCPTDSRLLEAPGNESLITQPRAALTSYIGVNGTDHDALDGILLPKDHVTRTGEVTDGLSNTLLIGERPPSSQGQWGHWYAGFGQHGSGSPDHLLGIAETLTMTSPYTRPCDKGPSPYRPGKWENPCDVMHFWSLHGGGANFVRADGSVDFLPYSIDQKTLAALATKAGDEVQSL